MRPGSAEVGRPYRAPLRLLDVWFWVAVIAVALLVAAIVRDRSVAIIGVERSLDVVFSAVTGVAALGVAVISYPRYRTDFRLARLVLVAAWVMFGFILAAQAVVVIARPAALSGFEAATLQQRNLWVALIVRSAIIATMLAAAAAALRDRRRTVRRPLLAALVPTVVLLVGELLLIGARVPLPPILDDRSLETVIRLPELVGDNAALAAGLGAMSPAAVMVGLIPASIALVTTIVLRLAWRRGAPAWTGYLAVGFVFVTAGQIVGALVPSTVFGVVTWADLLYSPIVLFAFASLVAEEREDLRRLEEAAVSEGRRRALEAEQVVLRERARLARELHDGLTQDLWIARTRLASLTPVLGADQVPVAESVDAALADAAIAAREALASLRGSAIGEEGIAEAIRRDVREIADPTGLEVRLSVTPTIEGDRLPGGAADELRRIIREALINVVRHADASVAWVTLDLEGEVIVATVTDNGQGFDPNGHGAVGQGRRGMAERTSRLGGTIAVTSSPHAGTTVEVRIPAGRVPGAEA